mmetsp:Transcript_27382/g.64674  ORF Transcript_27382/g.64674 Transcript_27382/m.64674 type:complete len:210 (-) Transcript_27382:194-823(-)
MACVTVTNVTVLDNPARFENPFQFEIEFECIAPIPDDIEWKLTYVGSAESDDYDQLLDSVDVGPMQVGPYKFVFQAEAPDPRRIPTHDILGVTVILLSCFYHEKEFIRIGYYVNTEYDAPELMEAPPEQILYERLVRNILVDKPRVTRYQIDWADNSAAAGAMAEATTETPATAGATEQSGSFDSMHSAMGMPMADESMAVEAPMVMAE